MTTILENSLMTRLRLIRQAQSESRAPGGPKGPSSHELELVLRAVAGEDTATRVLLNRVAPSMLRVIRTILGVAAAEAEDVLQESLIGLVAALRDFRGDCGLRHFGCRIAVRAAVRARRRAAVRQQRCKAATVEQDILQPGSATPGELVVAERRKVLLRGLLDELPEPQAETLTLRILLGFSLEEVAAATGAPLNTVRSRLRLAKEALRQRIVADPALAELVEVHA